MAKVALITGATSGIGKATSLEFAKHGIDLILTGRRKDRLHTICQQIERNFHVSVKYLCFDIRDNEACQESISSLNEKWRDIDILINNAGLAKGLNSIEEGKIEHWETMIDTNIKGLLYMTRIVAPIMKQRGSGHIINIASTAGKDVYPNGNVYCATKHAVDALTKAMRIDLHKYNIRVGQVAPGAVEETEFAQVRQDGDLEKAKIYEDYNPLSAKDVAEAIYFIVSRPPHVNIQDLLIMGTQQANAYTFNKSGRIFD